jgi:putative ABC transport system permease protein
MTIPFEDIRKKEFSLFFNDAVYTKNQIPFPYPFTYSGTRSTLTASEGEGVNIKISGILRLKEGLTYGCLSSGLNLTEKLVESYIEKNKTSQIVSWMNDPQNAYQIPMGGNIVTCYRSPALALNEYYAYSEEISDMLGADAYLNISQSTTLRAIGGNSMPNAIDFYPVDFDAKAEMLTYLDRWNNTHEEEDKITYTDTVGIMMGMVQTMLNAVTYVLVAFTAISLVVSSVMIGIITYVSVVERTKEIGVLRSLGARKKDIRNLFNAETFIIGLTAGLIGVGSTYLISLAINAILTPLTGIHNLANLPISSALIMTAISVGLTLISGLIPARSAARKDPVIALRSE